MTPTPPPGGHIDHAEHLARSLLVHKSVASEDFAEIRSRAYALAEALPAALAAARQLGRDEPRDEPGDDGHEAIYIIFDGPPSPPGGRFVEVESAAGRGMRIGEWQEYAGHPGLWRLGPIMVRRVVLERDICWCLHPDDAHNGGQYGSCAALGCTCSGYAPGVAHIFNGDMAIRVWDALVERDEHGGPYLKPMIEQPFRENLQWTISRNRETKTVTLRAVNFDHLHRLEALAGLPSWIEQQS